MRVAVKPSDEPLRKGETKVLRLRFNSQDAQTWSLEPQSDDCGSNAQSDWNCCLQQQFDRHHRNCSRTTAVPSLANRWNRGRTTLTVGRLNCYLRQQFRRWGHWDRREQPWSDQPMEPLSETAVQVFCSLLIRFVILYCRTLDPICNDTSVTCLQLVYIYIYSHAFLPLY